MSSIKERAKLDVLGRLVTSEIMNRYHPQTAPIVAKMIHSAKSAGLKVFLSSRADKDGDGMLKVEDPKGWYSVFISVDRGDPENVFEDSRSTQNPDLIEISSNIPDTYFFEQREFCLWEDAEDLSAFFSEVIDRLLEAMADYDYEDSEEEPEYIEI